MGKSDEIKNQELLEWAYREAIRTEFLETKEEVSRYMAALYIAALWGENIK